MGGTPFPSTSGVRDPGLPLVEVARLVVEEERASGEGDGEGVELAMASQGEGMRGDSLSVSPNMMKSV